MATVGFLHTSAVHVPVFEALVRELEPPTRPVAIATVVDDELLAEARRSGPGDPAVATGIERALAELTAAGADRVVCTCSTIGGAAEIVGQRLGVEVVRVDRAMAEAAVETDGRIRVLAALESTIGPTTELLVEAAAQAGTSPDITTSVVDGAWARFEAGDLDGPNGYYALIAREAVGTDTATRSDVVVLAQASMEPAADLVASDDSGRPVVLSSPRLAVERLLRDTIVGNSGAPGPDGAIGR